MWRIIDEGSQLVFKTLIEKSNGCFKRGLSVALGNDYSVFSRCRQHASHAGSVSGDGEKQIREEKTFSYSCHPWT